jgi:hypothetical protein
MFAPFALMGIALLSFIGGEIVKLLWNWLVPPLFGWSQVTFWQALGLLALCRILFGGNGLMGGKSRRYSPEERERFRAGFQKRFGFTLSGEEPTRE